MTDGLSISAAAREAGAAVALITRDGHYSFAELAQLAQQRVRSLPEGAGPVTVVGTNTLDTLVTLYALLEARRPALLLHPKLTGHEHAQEIAATRQAAGSMPPDAAAIIYTSGTSGHARGAVLTRGALLASLAASAANLGWQADDCWLATMPLARVGGLSIVTRCLAARRPFVLAETFDAATLPALLAEHRVTLLSLVPTMLVKLLDAHPAWRAPAHLRALLLGGAPASPRLLQRAADRGLPIVITYGCTETCSQIVATPYAQRHAPAACGVGHALSGAQLRVDTRGHVLVRGPMRMAGYLGESPLAGDAWFDTGDLGDLDAAGNLHLHARRTDLIISGGENVYPPEVEHVLESCPGVSAAAVFGVADETWGQLVAAVLVADQAAAAILPDRLPVFLAQRLAPHKRPRRLGFLAELPQTPAGKLDRAALAARPPHLHSLHHRS